MSQGSQVDARVRSLLARVLEQSAEDVRGLHENTPLFGGGLSLDSLTGLELLTGIEHEFGVDIASDDLNLDSLQTIGTLVDYLVGRLGDK
jgi:acyl carrier protein